MVCLSVAPPHAPAMIVAGQVGREEDVHSLLEGFIIGNVEALVTLFAANRANARPHTSH